MRLYLHKKQVAATLLPIILLLSLLACDGSTGFHSDSSTYRMTGLIVKDLNQATAQAEVTLLANDELDSTAQVILRNDTLSWSVDHYTLGNQPAGSYLAGSYLLTLEEGTSLDQSTTTNLPGNPGVTVTNPANRLNTGGSSVTVTFATAQYAEGYAVAAVHRDSVYTGYGYCDWVTSQANGATIPPDAFRLTDGVNPDSGWYYIYIYAYAEAPDSVLSHGLLPVPLPSVLTDNIDEKDFEGRFGGVVVSVHDSVRVPLQ